MNLIEKNNLITILKEEYEILNCNVRYKEDQDLLIIYNRETNEIKIYCFSIAKDIRLCINFVLKENYNKEKIKDWLDEFDFQDSYFAKECYNFFKTRTLFLEVLENIGYYVGKEKTNPIPDLIEIGLILFSVKEFQKAVNEISVINCKEEYAELCEYFRKEFNLRSEKCPGDKYASLELFMSAYEEEVLEILQGYKK